jgi:hypothetical protein
LTVSAAGSIADVLQAHPALQQLALSRNSLTDAGVHQLCAGAWKTLKHLELADCGVTSKVCSLRSLGGYAAYVLCRVLLNVGANHLQAHHVQETLF